MRPLAYSKLPVYAQCIMLDLTRFKIWNLKTNSKQKLIMSFRWYNKLLRKCWSLYFCVLLWFILASLRIRSILFPFQTVEIDLHNSHGQLKLSKIWITLKCRFVSFQFRWSIDHYPCSQGDLVRHRKLNGINLCLNNILCANSFPSTGCWIETHIT